MNSNECKIKIKVYYKDKQFEEESEYIIPLQKIKEKAIKDFDIIKEDEDFINFTYRSNKENKIYLIENDNDIIKYCDEDSSGDLFCKLELVVNNPKSKMKENKLCNENEGDIIESKQSDKEIKIINEKITTDIKEGEKENYKNEISKLKLEIEKINSEFTNLKKENSEKVKENEQIINDLKENFKNKEIEITNNKSKINNLSSVLEETKKECETINKQKLQIESKYQHFNVDLKEFIKKVDENYKNLLNKISTLEGEIEKMILNKNILDEYRNERKEEKKEMEENEKNKNNKLIKNVIEQMKFEQKNEILEINKKLQEENKDLKNQIKKMENENNKNIKNLILALNKMYEEMSNQEIKKSINSIFDKINEINAYIKENDIKKSKISFSKLFKRDSKKNKNFNLNKKKENKNSFIINNDKSQISQENNRRFLSEYVIYGEENKINILSKNTNSNNLDNKDQYDYLSEQLKIFYESNISKENILEILNKIKEIIMLVQ